MNPIKHFPPMGAFALATAFSLFAVALHITTTAKAHERPITFGSAHTPDALQAYSLGMQPDPNGGFTVRSNSAAHDWHPGTDIPSRKDGEIDPKTGKRVLKWPIVAQFPTGYPSILWYGKVNPDSTTEVGRFRTSNWSNWGTPVRWAYLRLDKEVWNEEMGRMDVPGLPGSPPAPAPPTADKPGVYMSDTQGQWLIDDLKRSFTTEKLMTFMDLSPYDEPDTGAPEDGPAGPQSANTDWLDHVPTFTTASSTADWDSPLGVEADDPIMEPSYP